MELTIQLRQKRMRRMLKPISHYEHTVRWAILGCCMTFDSLARVRHPIHVPKVPKVARMDFCGTSAEPCPTGQCQYPLDHGMRQHTYIASYVKELLFVEFHLPCLFHPQPGFVHFLLCDGRILHLFVSIDDKRLFSVRIGVECL